MISTKVGALRWRDYWEPVHPERGGRIVLEPEIFYLLLSAEGVSIPPSYAAEMLAYDPTAGELRTHYAGFFDPGFGYCSDPAARGSRAAPEAGPATSRSWSSTASPSASSPSSAWPSSPMCSMARTSARTTRGRRRCWSKHFIEQRQDTRA